MATPNAAWPSPLHWRVCPTGAPPRAGGLQQYLICGHPAIQVVDGRSQWDCRGQPSVGYINGREIGQPAAPVMHGTQPAFASHPPTVQTHCCAAQADIVFLSFSSGADSPRRFSDHPVSEESSCRSVRPPPQPRGRVGAGLRPPTDADRHPRTAPAGATADGSVCCRARRPASSPREGGGSGGTHQPTHTQAPWPQRREGHPP